MSEGLEEVVVSILVGIFLISLFLSIVMAIMMWNIIRKQRRPPDILGDFLRNPNQPPLINKAYSYSFVLLWLIAMSSLLILVKLS